jgi:hypothetical protein
MKKLLFILLLSVMGTPNAAIVELTTQDLTNALLTLVVLNANVPKNGRLEETTPYKETFYPGSGTILSFQQDPEPLLNLRYEIENLTDSQQFFSLQVKFPTDITLGPTFNDTFANIELFDTSGDGSVTVSDNSTFFEVIDDPGGDLINGSATLGSAVFQRFDGAGKYSMFDDVGTGPDANDFGGSGFNFMRFVTAGYLSAGDKLAITGMGCYSTISGYCPERYELSDTLIPPPPVSNVPVPAAVWLFGTALVGFIGVSRRRKVA